MTVLVIACPHALGLAIPLVIALSTAVSARNGILVKDRLALERMRTITPCCSTRPAPSPKAATSSPASPATGSPTDEVLRLGGGGRSSTASTHSPERSSTAAREHGEPARAIRIPGAHRPGRRSDHRRPPLRSRRPGLLRERSLDIPHTIQSDVDAWSARGAAVLYLVQDDEIIGAFALEDEVRPEARQAVVELHDIGIERVVMITGDARQVAEPSLPNSASTRCSPRCCPRTSRTRSPNSKPAATRWPWSATASTTPPPSPAPTSASRSVPAPTSPSSPPAWSWPATTHARSSASSGSPRRRYRKMVQNLSWAAGYNIVAIPLAAGALAWAGITLAPAVGAILMSVSTIVVALNAQLLRRVQLRPDDTDDTQASTPATGTPTGYSDDHGQ